MCIRDRIIRISKINIDETPFEYILQRLAACVMPVGLFAIGIILSLAIEIDDKKRKMERMLNIFLNIR